MAKAKGTKQPSESNEKEKSNKANDEGIGEKAKNDSKSPGDEPESNQQESDNSRDKPRSDEELIAIERDKYLRLAAEYDNYRKRSAKEREMTYNDARVDAISKLLPVYDNLDRALKMECSDEAYYKGVEMIMTGLLEIFEDMGVKEIKSVGEVFDPKYHNAVSSVDDSEYESNTIAQEYQKGFTLGERVIRFSTVVVAN